MRLPLPRRASAILPLAALTLSCGGPDARLEPRFLAVHNTLSALGLAQSGPIMGGSLASGDDARVLVPLEAGECVLFVGIGSGGVRDLDVVVLDERGETIAEDATTDRHAAVQACPARPGEVAVVVRMAEGEGEYTLGTFRGGSGGGGAVAARGGGGTCERPTPIALGQPIRGSTRGAASRLDASCAQGGAPEQVYALDVPERATLSAVLDSEFDGVLYLRRACAEGPELACNDDAPPDDTRRSEIRTTVDPGRYFLVVDGFGEEAGDFQLIASLSPLRALAEVCGELPSIAPGQAVTGDTSTSADYFQATCAGGARSPDAAYRFEVRQRSRLRIRQQSDHDGALHLRRTCEDPTTEIACNDDFADQRRSLVRQVVEPGTYTIVSDGYGEGSAGPFSFTAELEDVDGTGVPGDTCRDAAPIAGPIGAATTPTAVEVDTFRARDDLAGSCGGAGAPEVVHVLDVPARSLFRAAFEEAELAPALYLRRACDAAAQEVLCAQGPVLRGVLQAGRYHLVVDGAGVGEYGAGRLAVSLDDIAPLERACRAAPALRPGQEVAGETRGGTNLFGASCAADAGSPERLYRLVVRRRSVVRLELSTPEHDGALHLRRDCVDPASEVACNDDHEDNRHSRIEETLDPGTYTVVVDGFRTDNAGDFTLRTTVTPAP